MSDQKPLTSIMRVKDLGFKLLMQQLQLEGYDCEAVYKLGLQNSKASALNTEVSDSRGNR